MFGADAVAPRSLSDRSTTRRVRASRLIAVAVAVGAAAILAVSSPAWAAQTTTYSAEQTIPVPPASNYASPGGGDGWAVALSDTQVFNVFHHQSTLTVACHEQSTGADCWGVGVNRTITDTGGHQFASQGQPGMYLDPNTGKLYVYATRDDGTGGVVCVDTTQGATSTDPFCGFTALTGVGDAVMSSWSAIGAPALIGSRLYAFNYFTGSTASGARNAMLCFDVSTDAACSGQPFAVPIGAGVASVSLPVPATAAIGGRVIVPITVGSTSELACFDDSTQGACGGSWPVALSFSYVGQNGAPFPLLDAAGAITGVCLPTSADQCFGPDGSPAATPANLPSVVFPSDVWNGPAFVLGPRVYVPNGQHPPITGVSGDYRDAVQCFDYSTGASCANFPKTFTGLGYLYTVNPDPQRPTCIWVNADDGDSQIQSFDAYSGGQCGQGAIRVLASQFVVGKTACFPTAYQSLQVVSPARGSYSDGSIAFQDGDGNPIPGASNLALDQTGAASLQGLNLNSPNGLPQFVITLNGQSGSPGQVVVKLVWTATYDPSCVRPGISATPPAPPAPPASAPAPSVVKVSVPRDLTPPTISGRAVPGAKLTCLPGDWSGSPSSFTYTWTRNGSVIAGATGASYLVSIGDEAAKIDCLVTAHNAGGSAIAFSAKGLRAVLCPEPSGSLGGAAVGVFVIGEGQTRARKRLDRFRVTHNRFDNFCLYHGWGIRLGYPSPALLSMLPGAQRNALRGTVVLALTANPFYALDGVRPGMRVASVTMRLHLSKPFHVGRNFWYFAPGGRTRGVLKVRHGVIQEVGLASRALTRGRAAQRRFIRSFNDV